jgi:methionyl-tRNA formyltransferase
LDKEEARISWNLGCLSIHNTVRAFTASHGAFVTIRGKRLKVWRTALFAGDAGGVPGTILFLADGDPVIACADGAIRLMEVQSEGKRRVSGAEWRRGARLEKGDVLTTD